MRCFDLKSCLDIIKKVLPPKNSSYESLLNNFFIALVQTQIYYQQNGNDSREWIVASSISKILKHERKIPEDIKKCAEAIEAGSNDFEKLRKSVEKQILQRIGLESNSEKIIKEIVSKMEQDSFISESNKEMFRETAQKKTPAYFLAEVLLYLFSNDPKPINESFEKRDVHTREKEDIHDRPTNRCDRVNIYNNLYKSRVYLHLSSNDRKETKKKTNVKANKKAPRKKPSEFKTKCKNQHVDKNEEQRQHFDTKDLNSNLSDSMTDHSQEKNARPRSLNDKERLNLYNRFYSSSETKEKALYPDYIDLNYYNVFVIEMDDFKEGISLITPVIDERFTEPKIKEKIDRTKLTIENILQAYPSVFVPKARETDLAAQFAYVGFVDGHTRTPSGREIIKWHYIMKLPLQDLRLWWDQFSLCDMEKDVTEIDLSHWAIKKGDLLRAVKNASPELLPKIPGVNSLLRSIRMKYAGLNDGFVLEFVYCYYAEYTKNVKKMVKSLRIPTFTKSKIFSRKYTEFVFDSCAINTESEFNETLPNISFLTKLISKMEDKYVPDIKVRPILGMYDFNWSNCKIVEEGDHLTAWPNTVQQEAIDIEQSIGEMIEAILFWLVKKKKVNRQGIREQFTYLNHLFENGRI